MEYSLDGKEYIELNTLLKRVMWAKSGGEANQTISNGLVRVNNEKEFKRRAKVRAGSEVVYDGETCKVIA